MPSLVLAQIDTMITILPLEIIAPNPRTQHIGGYTKTFDATALQNNTANNISELLRNETGIYIKSYGMGSLATTSARGGSASHTLFLWNGLPLQSPMLGQLDASLLPMLAADEVSVQLGGSAAAWGSGAIGGAVHLNSRASFEARFKLQAQTTVGSFGNFQEAIQLRVGGARWQSATKVDYRTAKNDFKYEIDPSLPEREQTNAAFRQINILQDVYFKINDRQQIALHTWYQRADREIPPLITQRESQAHQIDSAWRAILEWKYLNNDWQTSARVGYFSEALNYFDDLISLESRSRFRTWMGEWEGQIYLQPKHRLHWAATFRQTQAATDGYDADHIPTEQRIAFQGGYQWQRALWNIRANLRQEVVDGKFLPIMPSVGVDKQINERWQWRAKVSRNYRLPTFNDRFWIPGGNPDLLPESGWSQQTTLAFAKAMVRSTALPRQHIFKASLTGFNRNIQHWIMWTPDGGQGVWSPTNVTKVWSRGLEARLHWHYQHQKHHIKWSGNYYWTRSTNQIALTLPDIPEGQQLFYTPIHQWQSSISYEYQWFRMAYAHDFTDEVLGINENVAAYHLGRVEVSTNFQWRQLNARLLATVFNVWDTNYYAVERRPMAGRHYQVKAAFFMSE